MLPVLPTCHRQWRRWSPTLARVTAPLLKVPLRVVLPVTPSSVPPTVAPVITQRSQGRRTTAQGALEGGVACHSQRATDGGVAGGRQRRWCRCFQCWKCGWWLYQSSQRAGHRSASQGRRTTAPVPLRVVLPVTPNVPPTVAPLIPQQPGRRTTAQGAPRVVVPSLPTCHRRWRRCHRNASQGRHTTVQGAT